MNMNDISDIKKTSKGVLDAIVLLKNKERESIRQNANGAPQVNLEAIVQKLSAKMKRQDKK